jgi:hypothetical protein
LGQIKKTQQQIQNEIDEIHKLISQGATDEYIMNGRKDAKGASIRIARATYFRRKQRLIAQVADTWRAKQDEDYIHEVQICKERLTQQLVNAQLHCQPSNANPYWAVIAGELTVSILKLEVEGIQAIKNGRLRQLEQKVGYSGSLQSGAAVSDSTDDGLDEQTRDSASQPA